MDDVPGVETVNYTYMYVVPSPLVGVIDGGSIVRRKWNTNITIDAQTLVYDPDIGPGNWDGMSWKLVISLN